MKVTFLRLATLATAVSLLALTSCKKEQLVDESMFLATIENQQNKTTIGFDTDGTGYMHWESTDLIAIYGTVSTTTLPVSFSATPDDGDASVAIFARTNGDNDEVPEGNDRYAIYPYSIAAGHTTYGTVTLPATQTYSGNRLEAPMWAQSTSDNQLAFKNLCGVLKITQAGNYTVSSIGIKTVGTGEYVCGDFAINSTDASNPQLAYSANGSDTLTLLCNNASSTGSTFFVYLPAQTYTAGMTITLNTNHGQVVHTLNSNLTIARNTCYTVNFAPVGAINGLFSVSDTKKVYFSKGNLKCTRPNTTTAWADATLTWSFMDNQWDTEETNNLNTGTQYANCTTVSLFGFGTSGANSGWIDDPNNTNYTAQTLSRLYDGPYCTYNTGWFYGPREQTNDGTTYSSFKMGSLYYNTCFSLTDNPESDWCYHNAISNGGNAEHIWRTLTAEEWRYLFKTRDNADNKYGMATVNGVCGLILLPDVFTDPLLNATTNSNANNHQFLPRGGAASTAPNKGYECNIYSGDDWAAMEARGAVFLPAAGRRGSGYTNKHNDKVDYVNGHGIYHSATHYNDAVANLSTQSNYQYKVTFTNTTISIANASNSRSLAGSVRAVMDAN